MKKYILTIALFISTLALYATDHGKLFEKANAAYKSAQYDTAVANYLLILKSGTESAEIYFNLGNAYYKKKDIAKAILYFERAKILAPGDDDINFNLQLAQTMVVDKINVLPEFFLKKWWRIFSMLFSSNTWAMLSMYFFVATLLFVLLYLFTSKITLKILGFWLALFCIVVSLISFSHSFSLKRTDENKSGSIVTTPTISVKSSPDENGTDIFVLHEGTKVMVIDHLGEWLKVKIADGNTGWLKKSDTEEI